MSVVYGLKTGKITIEYTESDISCPILWESHCHLQYEMIAVDKGDITVMLEGQNYRLKENQIIIVPPLLYHSVTANEKGSYRRITALFEADTIPKALQDSFLGEGKHTTVSRSQMEKIKSVCQKENKDYYAPLLHSLMIELFYDMLQPPSVPVKIETDEFLQKALQYIDKNLNKKILLDDLAKATARSKSSFCHLFEEKMKISPKQYILQKKLALANKLISERVPHTVAATLVGYENYSNFYRLYRKNIKN